MFGRTLSGRFKRELALEMWVLRRIAEMKCFFAIWRLECPGKKVKEVIPSRS